MHIFFSSSSFWVSVSWRSFSFFFSSAIFSFFWSSLTSESAEPIKATNLINLQIMAMNHHSSIRHRTEQKPLGVGLLTHYIPAEIRLPLLAIMSWSLLSMLDSLLIRGAPISVRSIAMSPELLVDEILDCTGREGARGWETEGRREKRSRGGHVSISS